MKFFISGELDGQISNQYRRVRNEIESKLKTLEDNDYGSEFIDIGIIPIIIDSKKGAIRRSLFQRKSVNKTKGKGSRY